MAKILVFCDGSCLGNPGPGGYGIIIVTKDHIQELGGFSAHTTNNQMELTAALIALRHTTAFSTPLDFYSDSQYLIQGITKWIKNWKKNHWLTSQKKPVLNKTLWQELDEATLNQKVNWHSIKAHSGLAGNERADEIANQFSRHKKTVLFNGPSQDYPISQSRLLKVG